MSECTKPRTDPFLADENRFQFSTKRCDRTTNFELYEYRVRCTDSAWLSRDPIGHLGGKNEYAFCGNDAVRRTDSFGYWAESGHFYTTYIVARMTGLYDADAAYRLAFSSQHPDEAPGYDAIKALSVLPGSPEWSRMIQEELHSLHGGDAKKRRACLQLVVSGKCGGTLKDWERGFVIHAFGDSFAHTQPNGNNYKFPLGHAKDVHEPDTISADPKKYLEYAQALFQALGGTDESRLQRLKDMVATIPSGTPEKDYVGKFHDLAVGPYGYAHTYRPENMETVRGTAAADITGIHFPRPDEVKALLEKIQVCCGCSGTHPQDKH